MLLHCSVHPLSLPGQSPDTLQKYRPIPQVTRQNRASIVPVHQVSRRIAHVSRKTPCCAFVILVIPQQPPFSGQKLPLEPAWFAPDAVTDILS
jgi:hypothetical protein